MSIVAKLCTPLLTSLIAKDFRAGFEDGVINRCKQCILDAGYTDEARKFWSDACCFSYMYAPEGKVKKWYEVYGKEFTDLYLEATRIENLEGCFEMPTWGTRGT
jgi:hypothetical protein